MNTQAYSLLGLIPLLPLVGATINAVLGHKLPRRLVHWIACSAIGLSLLFSILALKALIAANPHGSHTDAVPLTYTVYEWFRTGTFEATVAFYFDQLTAVMCLLVTGVSFLIHLYSVGYLAEDRSYSRYFTYLNFFCFAMLLLVMADNLVILFVGWEGVGLASYLLIGFWFEDPEKAKAGKKAFIVNRIGDTGVLIGLFLLFTFTRTLHIPTLDGLVGTAASSGNVAQLMPTPFGVAVGILLFMGCTGKSAQLPLYVWLPDAMAGPTPVSALIHAATMVTAGIYLIARLGFFYTVYPAALAVIAVVGVITALMAATIAICQTDIKKILAYSTISQLGFMFVAVGVGAFAAGIFHLMTHAFFKALLFLGAGAVIHGLHGEQDITRMGGLRRDLPITHWTFLIACLAISGIPLFSGFFSKDEILWASLNGSVTAGWAHSLIWAVGVVSAGITALYIFRLYFKTFWGPFRPTTIDRNQIHRPPVSMLVPLLLLGILSALGGFVSIPQFLGGADHLHHWLGQVLPEPPYRLAGAWEWAAMAASVAVGLVGLALAWWLYVRHPQIPQRIAARMSALYRLVRNKYFVDEAYAAIVVWPLKATADLLFAIVDRVLIDTLLVHSVGFIAKTSGLVVKKFQNGEVQRYAFFILLGLSLTLFIIVVG